MTYFNFRKIVHRSHFTTIFGSVGTRRTKLGIYRRSKWAPQRFKMQKIRRAHQGWRNKRIGSIQAIKTRLKYGRRKPVPQFRR